ncbi:tetrahydrofolate dehydrogenase/cyclohydrolase catalytic domain-containing protein [Mycoplasma sp. 332]|uniref:tetrahydrofolate dehydrogenase/cyclohydrolase catalytic domain-containing protein n=1 Tax=Mycoplasma sp. 332 TaxID=3458236 RepID=UPI0040350328
MYNILDGKKTKEEIQTKIKKQFENMAEDKMPILGILQVGDLEESNIYIKHKLNIAHFLGFKTKLIKLNRNVSEEEIKHNIDILNKETTGFLVQLPLQTDKVKNLQKLLNCINITKDIDGLTQWNQEANFLTNFNSFLPATALGVVILLKKYQINFNNMNIAVVGQSKIVGKPLADYFEQNGSHVRRYDINTPKDDLLLNDLVVVATGCRGCLDGIKLKDNVILIDVGIHRINGLIVGDIDISKINNKISYLTPVPGGVGPMTIIALMLNLVKAYDIQNDLNFLSKILIDL